MGQNKPKSGKTIVYRAVNTVTGGEYIGITDSYLATRKSKHIWCAIKQSSRIYFHRSIRKYGRDSFTWEVVAEFSSYEEAKREEIRLIAERRPRYNLTKGGDGTVGFTIPREITDRLAAQKRGKPGPWRGKKMPASFFEGGARWKLSEAGKRHWKIAARLGPKSIQRKIVCLDDGKIYASIREAASAYDLSETMISSVCRLGRHKTAGGLVFRFYGEHEGGSSEAARVRESVLANRQRTAAIARSARLGEA